MANATNGCSFDKTHSWRSHQKLGRHELKANHYPVNSKFRIFPRHPAFQRVMKKSIFSLEKLKENCHCHKADPIFFSHSLYTRMYSALNWFLLVMITFFFSVLGEGLDYGTQHTTAAKPRTASQHASLASANRLHCEKPQSKSLQCLFITISTDSEPSPLLKIKAKAAVPTTKRPSESQRHSTVWTKPWDVLPVIIQSTNPSFAVGSIPAWSG